MGVCKICRDSDCHGDPQTECGPRDRRLDIPVLRGKKGVGKLMLSEAEAARVASMAVEGISMLQIVPVVRAEDNGTATLLYFELITPPAEPKAGPYKQADIDMVSSRLERFTQKDLQMLGRYLHAHFEPTLTDLANWVRTKFPAIMTVPQNKKKRQVVCGCQKTILNCCLCGGTGYKDADV